MWEAARELDYHPNAFARNLVSRRSHLLGLVVPGRAGMRHLFLYAVMCGVPEEIAGTGFGLTLSVAEEAASHVTPALTTVRQFGTLLW